MSDKLKECPFCGGVAKLEETDQWDGHTWWRIYCIQCESGWKYDDFLDLFATKDEAIKAWNRRPEDKADE